MAEDRPQPQGYAAALAAGRAAGAGCCTDAEAMALFCEADVQLLVGAVSPRLVWEGARKQGLSLAELGALASADPLAVADLMWA